MFVSGGNQLKSLCSNSLSSSNLTLGRLTVFNRKLALSIISNLQLSRNQIRCTATSAIKKEMLQWWVTVLWQVYIHFCVERKTSYWKLWAEFLLEPCASNLFTQGCVMQRYPKVLMLLLKRFMFDYSSWMNVKNNRPVDIPCTLQIPNVCEQYWCILYLFSNLYPKVIVFFKGEQNQDYELYAIVDHVGSLKNGHYSARIKDDKGWCNFNDSWVTLVRIIHLMLSC